MVGTAFATARRTYGLPFGWSDEIKFAPDRSGLVKNRLHLTRECFLRSFRCRHRPQLAHLLSDLLRGTGHFQFSLVSHCLSDQMPAKVTRPVRITAPYVAIPTDQPRHPVRALVARLARVLRWRSAFESLICISGSTIMGICTFVLHANSWQHSTRGTE